MSRADTRAVRRSAGRGAGRRLLLAAAGAAAVRGLGAALAARPPGGAASWNRTNFRGEQVSLLAGPALVGAAAATAALGAPSRALAGAAAVAGTGAGLVGLYDDVVGTRPEQRADKGFRGHLHALRQGRVSAGLVKVVGVGAVALAAARAVTGRPVDRVVTAGVVAGTANLVNLLDLRPGRALKAGLLLGVPLLPGPAGGLAAGPVGAAAALLPDDLGERVMLGDTGANALGAVLGLRLALAGGPRWRLGVLAVLTALTAASEKVSFTRVIESTPVLRQVDALGRRPGPQPLPSAPAAATRAR
jgi:UDP-N-acetylmuramyl pentapeptide phosphotransferase/UDP-N-acetylglucosamine-1-phosphate transferase